MKSLYYLAFLVTISCTTNSVDNLENSKLNDSVFNDVLCSKKYLLSTKSGFIEFYETGGLSYVKLRGKDGNRWNDYSFYRSGHIRNTLFGISSLNGNHEYNIPKLAYRIDGSLDSLVYIRNDTVFYLVKYCSNGMISDVEVGDPFVHSLPSVKSIRHFTNDSFVFQFVTPPLINATLYYFLFYRNQDNAFYSDSIRTVDGLNYRCLIDLQTYTADEIFLTFKTCGWPGKKKCKLRSYRLPIND
jgi:hypothetical protein